MLMTNWSALIVRTIEIQRNSLQKLSLKEIAEKLDIDIYKYFRVRFVWLIATGNYSFPVPDDVRKLAKELLAKVDNDLMLPATAYRILRTSAGDKIKYRTKPRLSPKFPRESLMNSADQRTAVERTIIILDGINLALGRIPELHKDISRDEIDSWVAQLTKQRASLSKVIKRLRSTSEQSRI